MRPQYRLQPCSSTLGTHFSPQGSSTPPSSGGIALVQSASGTTADGSAGLTVSFGVPVTAGNSVIALISGASDNLDGAALVGGGGPAIPSIAYVFGTGVAASVAAIHNTASGVTGATVAWLDAVRASMTILEFSGLANAAAESTNTRSGTAAELTFNEVTPTSAANLIVGIGAYANATSDYSSGPSAPFERVGTGTGGASVYQEVVYAIQAAADAQGASMTVTLGGEYAYATAAAVFGGA